MTITTMEVLLGHAEFIIIIWCSVLAFESNYLKQMFLIETKTKSQHPCSHRFMFPTKPKYLHPCRHIQDDAITVVKENTRIYS